MKAPGNWTIEGLFEGRPESYRLFQAVQRYIESIGPVNIEAAKTQVAFSLTTKFAWVWLPQMWIKEANEGSITLTFDLGRHVRHERIKQAVEPRPGRWTHHVVIEKESDLDDNVREWLREAYRQVEVRRQAARRRTRPVRTSSGRCD